MVKYPWVLYRVFYMSAPDAPASSGLSDERKRVADGITIHGEPKDLYRKALYTLSMDDEGARLVKVLHDTVHRFTIQPAAKMHNSDGVVFRGPPDFDSKDGKAVFDPYLLMSDKLDFGNAVLVLAHELRHLDQLAKGILTPEQQGRILPPQQATQYNWFIEADATATAIDVAWRLKQAGLPDAWNAARSLTDERGDVPNVYERAMLKTGDADAAKLAVFNSWFSDGFIETYTHASTHSMSPKNVRQRLLDLGAQISELTQDDVTKFGSYLSGAMPVEKYFLNSWQLGSAGRDKISQEIKIFEQLIGYVETKAGQLQDAKVTGPSPLEQEEAVRLARVLEDSRNNKIVTATPGQILSQFANHIRHGQFRRAGIVAVESAIETLTHLADGLLPDTREVRQGGAASEKPASKFTSTPAAETEQKSAVQRAKTPGMKM